MKTLTLLSLIAALALIPTLSRGAAGDLEHPGVAYPGDYSEEGRKAVASSLTLDGCEYLGGRWINSLTTLYYSGDSRALSGFLDALSKCPGASISIAFADALVAGEDWQVQHQGHDHHFHILINLGSKRISLPKIDLPVIVAKADPPVAAGETALIREPRSLLLRAQ